MAYNRDEVLHRDKYRCRLRYHQCDGQATTTLLNIPEFLNGPNSTDNTISVCRNCLDEHLPHRERAAAIFNAA